MVYFTSFTQTQTAEFYEPSGNKILYNEAQVAEIHNETSVYINRVYTMRRKLYHSSQNLLFIKFIYINVSYITL